jgi:hypothetical protein
MHVLSTSVMLELWEQGLIVSPVEWTLLSLTKACPERSLKELADMPIGQRDALLLNLRNQIFGSRLTGTAVCCKCSERLEIDFCSRDILASIATMDLGKLGPFIFNTDGFDIDFRLPNSIDIMATAVCKDISTAKQMIIKRCVLKAGNKGGEITAEQLPTETLEAISCEMGRLDPGGDIMLECICPKCGHKWLEIFDITRFLYKEIDAWAHHILIEVHILASAYGWSESDILAMSSRRRQAYLDMVEE